ncbi:hypothetical protein RAS12_09935 [Achromobacter seleniivolatilans]|uniref:Uncharacterized protein n=1 Tax=Achromobacter seleniivolatilans TaxID=3047478 RepID=A0ABY9MA71_9BURK|nr:hypothetical protein [Achromobacter sp. R39]WMD23888.1 hypothetical protein RAS12_09935 [Achromobacter sp. R39]
MKTIIDTSISVGIATITRRKISLSMWETVKQKQRTVPGGLGAVRARRKEQPDAQSASGQRSGKPPRHDHFCANVTPFRRIMPSG